MPSGIFEAAKVLLTHRQAIAADGAVNGEDAVEVIHFVLQKLGERARGQQVMLGALFIEIPQLDRQ